MRKVISLSVNDEIINKLDEFVSKNQTNRSDVVKKALRQYFYLIEMKNIRKKLRPYAEESGFFTDNDVFNEVS